MRKLIFFDIDGTIVAEGNPMPILPDSFLKALHSLQQNGHLCFINTGRALSEIDTMIRRLPFDGLVCGCGTRITYQGKELYSHTIPRALGKEILDSLIECRLEWVLEGTEHTYYSSEPCQTYLNHIRSEHIRLIPDVLQFLGPQPETVPTFDKFCICLGKGHHFEIFYSRYKDLLTFIDRKRGFYEIVPKGHSKASGIAFLEAYFGIPHKDTIAIGDSSNDLPMLQYADYSIAMGNSSKEVLEAADYVTGSVAEDGIYHAMQHLQLL